MQMCRTGDASSSRPRYFMGRNLDVMSLLNKVTMVTFTEHTHAFVKEGLGGTEGVKKGERISSRCHYVYLKGVLKPSTFFMGRFDDLPRIQFTPSLFHPCWRHKKAAPAT